MTPERAEEIVTAINARSLVSMGIEQPMGTWKASLCRR